jgi:rod shape-determining protein MreC
MRDLFRLLYRSRNTLLFLALLALSLALLVDGNQHHRAKAHMTAGGLVGRLLSWRSEVTEYAGLKEVNRRLAEENADLRSRGTDAYAPVSARFTRIHDTIHEQQFRLLSARVISSTVHHQKNHLLLDKGERDGVVADMGVIGSQGIVGVVTSTSPRFAVVKSVLSPDLKVSVKVHRTGHFGLLVWDTNDPTMASVTDIAKHARVREGDTLVTRGGDGIFPVDIPVGVVTHVSTPPGGNYFAITAHLIEDLSREGYVHIVFDLMRAERDSLEAKLGNE